MDKNSVSRFSEKANRSFFFFGAILFHLVLFLMIVGWVVFPQQPAEKPISFEPTPFSPPERPKTVASSDNNNPAPSAPAVTINPLHSDSGEPGYVSPPHVSMGDPLKDVLPGAGTQIVHDLGSPKTAPSNPKKGFVDVGAFKQTIDSYDPNHTGHMRFPIYLAKYADGDWDCNTYFHGQDLTSGCLPNLLAKVDEWSHGDLKSKEIKVVALDSPELVENPAPFIFFTGHKDFILTDAEIVNLRKYLQNGGVIWGDSAFSGDGSRFDVAFHREMKRVLPDADKQFEPLSTDHPIFSQSRFKIEDLPKGMNYRADPIECINLGGKLAVLYTPNDYSDMMTMLLLPGRDEHSAQEAPENHWTAEHPLFTPSGFNAHQATFFRNYDAASAMTSYKLSMNILVHLLHRYDDELLLTP